MVVSLQAAALVGRRLEGGGLTLCEPAPVRKEATLSSSQRVYLGKYKGPHATFYDAHM